MNAETVTIQVDPSAAAILQKLMAQAEAHGETLATLLEPLVEQNGELTSPPRNEALLAVIQQTSERLKDMPVSGSTADTLKMIREARAGGMWGYEPSE